MPETVAILGASNDPARYAHRAQSLLLEKGHRVIPVHPSNSQVGGIDALPGLDAITSPVDTLTLYLRPEKLLAQTDAILALRPGRVIFNPGTESPALEAALTRAEIPWEEACTLVLLRTNQF